MVNYYENAKTKLQIFNQLACKDLLFVHYRCPFEVGKTDNWSEQNFILYILSGKKGYHTPGRSWILNGGEAAFVKKGACIVEKYFTKEVLCIITFFIPDCYLKSFAQDNDYLVPQNISDETDSDLLFPLDVNEMMAAYVESLIPYFYSDTKPSEALLELKFRELLLNILSNPANQKLNNYLRRLTLSQVDNLRQIMDANCLYNLKLEDYAKLNNQSLSSFKRHFLTIYKTTPGQWLLNKKLEYAHKLLLTSDRSVTDISFESGFEDSTHFSHAFKKHFGESPSKYRVHFNAPVHA